MIKARRVAFLLYALAPIAWIAGACLEETSPVAARFMTREGWCFVLAAIFYPICVKYELNKLRKNRKDNADVR